MDGDGGSGAGARPVRRQARGERRIAQILDAAAGVLAESGYEAATTNRIAAAAGISPGSLYQFFPNKEAIARALADRFAAGMGGAHRSAFEAADPAAVPLAELIDGIVDPLMAFNLANPGFKALFARPDMPAELSAATRPIQDAVLGRVAGILAARAPGLPEDDRTRGARVLIQVFKALVPLVAEAASQDERDALMAELKRVLAGYMTTLEARGAARTGGA
ncbi:TetR/AcrR family transcriptional regulator [Actinomadura sp. WAC 06369]|uniref:TetR/AcrR family transcriptional regulator n=1 Tax=Actinomadura sp. WAC 06369 TaxID=2203193 RepID=UPI000F79062A|nr:TetR/AcrR family transcriptional regulator [Actinomadura sp. WAC 06369]RSN40429.1 TetR/AcrR family transcriptional regulator [Actinomadura sp. WAC 06369]